MKTMHSRVRYSLPSTIVLLGMLALGPTAGRTLAETNDEPRIIFLHLQLRPDKSVKLLDATSKKGHLKSRPIQNIPDAIHFELLSTEGRTLWHGMVADPSVRDVEYEDPLRAGQMKRKQFRLIETEFTVRVPGLADARRVEFYTLGRDGTNDATRKKLGTFPLPAE